MIKPYNYENPAQTTTSNTGGGKIAPFNYELLKKKAPTDTASLSLEPKKSLFNKA